MAKKLLIVDDERDIAFSLKEFFLSKGYETQVAFSGEEAIRNLGDIRFDLILLDIQIPGVNGVQVLKEAKKIYPGIKTIVLTGFLEEYKTEVEQIGCDALLSKPYSINTVSKIADSILSEDRFNYQKTLIEASKGMVLITDIQKLLNLIVYIVKRQIGVNSACVFQYDEEQSYFILKSRRGDNRELIGFRIGQEHPLVTYLKDKKSTFLRQEEEMNIPSELKQELERLDCEVCVPSFSKGKLLGFLILGPKLSGETYTKEEIVLLSTLANEVAFALENAKNFMELKRLREDERESYFQTVLALAKTVDEKDTYTRGHLDEVARYGMEVAAELTNSNEIKINMEELKVALLLHDIGKIGVPDALLHKNGSLTPEEWEIMKQHPVIGARIIEPVTKLKNAGRIIRYHQEKFDGSGYPEGKKGNEIPLESRIIAVVDAYHAMVSDRPYRKAMSAEVALEELKKNSGTQFDPKVVDAFVRAWEKGKIVK